MKLALFHFGMIKFQTRAIHMSVVFSNICAPNVYGEWRGNLFSKQTTRPWFSHSQRRGRIGDIKTIKGLMFSLFNSILFYHKRWGMFFYSTQSCYLWGGGMIMNTRQVQLHMYNVKCTYDIFKEWRLSIRVSFYQESLLNQGLSAFFLRLKSL